MPVGIKITEELFKQLKNELNYSEPLTVAIKNKMSVKTILQIKGSETYGDYTAQKKAQHPPTKETSIRDILKNLEMKLDWLIADSRNNTLL